MQILRWYCLWLLGFAWAVTAQQVPATSGPMQGKMEVSKLIKVREENGKPIYRRIKNIGEAKPGEILEYVITYTNSSTQTVKDIAIVGPIPAQTYVVARSIRTDKAVTMLVSIDAGGK